MKKIGRSDIIGQRGMAQIEGTVLAMGYMFYATGGVEAGIDGFIELRDVETGEVGNLLLQMQGKATERDRLASETDTSFEFPVSEADVAYWIQGTAPVLLIVVHLKSGKAYWKSVKEWFSDPERSASRKIVFDKARDEFTPDAKAAITLVALSARPGASSPSIRIDEDLLVNLVEVKFSEKLYWAPTEFATDKEFGTALRARRRDAPSEWIVRSKAVLSFHDLNQEPWERVCDAGSMEEFDTDEWAESDDEDRQRDFVALLNRAIGEFVRPTLYHDRESGVFYFRKPRDRDDLNYAYRSLRSTTTRRVVGRYDSKRKEMAKAAYWRHSGFSHRFVKLGGKWYIEITPTYHFTRDGQNFDRWSGERLKKIKELENNAAVMGQFVMWRDFLLTHGRGDLLKATYPFLTFAPAEALTLEVGVPDGLWASQEANPSSPLFDQAGVSDPTEDV